MEGGDRNGGLDSFEQQIRLVRRRQTLMTTRLTAKGPEPTDSLGGLCFMSATHKIFKMNLSVRRTGGTAGSLAAVAGGF